MTEQVTVGLIGAGGIAGAHSRGYNAIPDQVKVGAVADISTEHAARRAEELGGATTYTDFKEMLAKEDGLDAVDICLPHHLHIDAILAAADAGKHILCEKPLCISLEEAKQVEAAVKSNGVTIMCAHNQLFMPPVAKARELIQSGELGKVYELRTTDSFYGGGGGHKDTWRSHKATAGGGELIDTGYHPTYLLLHLAGAVPTEVTAMTSKHRLEHLEGEDSAQVFVRFDNGALGTIITSWAYEPAPGTERFSVVAEKGSLTSDGKSLQHKVLKGDVTTYEFDDVDGFSAEIAHFVDVVRGTKKPIDSHVEGINVLKVILGAYEAVDNKKTISLA